MSIVQHRDVSTFEIQGNSMKGIATPALGARRIEVWHTTIAPGEATPLHVHDDEEIVVVLSGRGEILMGEERVPFAAPCTLIAPARIGHQIFNVGDGVLETIAALPIGSRISTLEGDTPPMPWRT